MKVSGTLNGTHSLCDLRSSNTLTFQAPLMFSLDNLGGWDAVEDAGRAAVKPVFTYLDFGSSDL